MKTRSQSDNPASAPQPAAPADALRDRCIRALDAGAEVDTTFAALVAVAPLSAWEWLESCGTLTQFTDPEAAIAGLLTALRDARTEATTTALGACGRAFWESIPMDWIVPLVRTFAPDERLDRLAAAEQRFPDHAGVLLETAKAAAAVSDVARAHACLTRAATVDPQPTTVQNVWRVRCDLAPPDDVAGVRIALLSSYTIDPLLPHLDVACRQLDLAPSFWQSPFNAWAQSLVDAGSAFYEFEADLAFLAVSIDDRIPDLARSVPFDTLMEQADALVDDIAALAERHAANGRGLLVVHTFWSAFPDPDGIAGEQGERSRRALLHGCNQRLRERLREIPRAFTLDLEACVTERDEGPHDPTKLRHMAAMRLGPGAVRAVARRSAGFVAAARGLERKCVVTDLDNTLWGGIVGEDGVHGIRLGPTSPGSMFVELQHALQALTQRGILLAINSKNNPDDALQAIREHESMVLREDAFSAVRINWRPKPENMREIAAELGIGIDSLVFLDDNPKEREQMRQMLPDVLTPELPADVSLWRQAIETLPQLQKIELTGADRTRHEQYRARRLRTVERTRTHSLDDYLQSLDICVRIDAVNEQTLSRVHQLFDRTNQFNLTTRRYPLGELEALANDDGARLYALHARDRFGDHGLVATALCRLDESAWAIDSLLMSCRVIGYGIETAFVATIATAARAHGARALRGTFIPTAKNAPAATFYDDAGFEAIESPDETRHFELDLERNGLDVPAWIQMESTP